ncbi:MAG TPA: hypothetical protein VM013_03080 [Dehalococcoidia bacterium]|nr:hypothetical protein [Dehalococcoidia bacterium]
MQLKTNDKAVRLDQLTEELRALPGLSGLQGLSARVLSSTGEIEIAVHTEGLVLNADEERAVMEAVGRHVPDPQWRVSADERELATILSQSEGSLGLAEIEKALRALARMVDTGRPEMMTIHGSDGE